ncbi:MAG: right-handed parallel beta-helix repeat-containing protein [Caldilineales bacterium]|nr:right-handed parallel beta-helix repeat-containing protein [Caldilineales bacterium]
MRKALKWIGIVLLVILALPVLALAVAAVAPEPADPAIDMANHGAGSSSVEPSYSGLQRQFPPLNGAAGTAEQVELGRLLFFDPVLSQKNDIACASCHQPDLGFSDGRPTPVGTSGVPLQRNAPSLWNVGFVQNLFWDGRETSLEKQVETPLTHPDEMGVTDTAALAAELAAIPEYAQRFQAAFGGEQPISLENMSAALAAFERSLLSQNSPFDRYAAGDFDALTPQQRRGLALFRSGATRCFECHSAPTFANEGFRVIGVPDDDPGRAAVAADALPGAFKTPTLRNIALSAPYMHDGSLATLEEVLDFYAEGAGRAHGAENVDALINGFDMSESEKADLLAFLYALTDESTLPETPAAVPSGLPVVQPQANPASDQAAAANSGRSLAAQKTTRGPAILVVQPGQTIQSVVDQAQPGDTIQIPYGVYHERVAIDANDITLEGIANADGDLPLIDCQNKLSEAVIASGSDFTVGNLHVRDCTDNGVLVEGATNVVFHDIFAEKTGVYGVYPVRSTNVIIERVKVTGANDAGVYAGQSENVIVRDSEVYGNVLGIELENTLGGEVYNNHVYDNTVGMLIVILPQLTSKISANTKIYANLVEANNHANFAERGVARFAPPGVGMLLLGTDQAEVNGNTVRDNKTAGVAVYSLTRSGVFDENEIDIGPLPEDNWVHGNSYTNNGYDPDPSVDDLGVPGADVLWDGSGSGNRFDEPGASVFPPLLPGSGWPAFLRRAYDNALNLAIERLL